LISFLKNKVTRYCNTGLFVTVRAGTAYRHLFFQSKEKKLFVMFIINE